MTRFVSVTVLVVVLTAGRIAHAEGTLPDGASITFDERKIHEDNDPDLVFPIQDPESSWHYFNLAHCQCGAPGINQRGADYHETEFAYLLRVASASTAPNQRTVDIWVGPECSNETTRPMSCHKVTSAGTVDSIKTSMDTRPPIPVFDLMVPTPATATTPADVTSCKGDTAESMDTVWLLVDGDGNGLPDYFVSQSVLTDSGPPMMPTEIKARGSESAIQLSWTPPPDSTDTYAYQALCARDSGNTPGRSSGRPDKLYDTAADLCGATDAATAVPLVAIPEDTPGTIAPTGALKNLDPTFLCGEEIAGTATGMRIGGLEDGVPYIVVLLAIDKFGNATGAYFTNTITPIPSVDFWEDLHGQGSDVEGGLCLIAQTYGDNSPLTGALRAFRDDTLHGSRVGRWLTAAYYATLGKLGGLVHGSVAARVVAGVVLAPVVVVALLWHWLTLPGLVALVALAWLWRRRRLAIPRGWLRVAAPAGALVVALAPGRAHAGGYQPYWENPNIADDQNPSFADDPGEIKWLVGVRVGPYTPDIDGQFNGTTSPYKQMFGGYQILTMLDVDRVVWSGFGQVGVGLSAGYMQKRARAFTVDSDPSDPMRARAADDNTFRLIPTALTATYRFTMLDDDYGIPVIPYARAGLSYYLWWISGADGIATVCKDGSDKDTNPGCSKDKALGASLGVQASIGLSIRAERIDAATANSMRQSGIQHAGIYGEVSLAKVDGFGSDKKLSVGDRTWFAGIAFEF